MENKRYKPLLDKLFFIIWVPTFIVMLALTVMPLLLSFYLPLLIALLATDVFVFYFLVSPLFGYVELGERSVLIKFGFILKREIPYEKIRGFSRERKFYADSMLSLKTALSHVNIKYNAFDVVSVSVIDSDGMIREIETRLKNREEL